MNNNYIGDDLDLESWQRNWDMNYERGYDRKLGFVFTGEPQPESWYFQKYLFPYWRTLKEEDDVLEIGCGNGGFASTVYHKVKSFTGTDISKVAIEHANNDYKTVSNVSFIPTTDILSLNKKFDLIYSVTVFQHLPRAYTEKYINDSRQLLKPGGRVFFQFLSGSQNKNNAHLSVRTIDQKENIEICEPSIGHSEEEIRSLFKEYKDFNLIRYDFHEKKLYWWFMVIAG